MTQPQQTSNLPKAAQLQPSIRSEAVQQPSHPQAAQPQAPSKPQFTHVVVPGTFDPPTFGHLDVIARAARLFDKVTVAVAASVGKNGTGPTFTLQERCELLRASLDELAQNPHDTQLTPQIVQSIEVLPFSGLLVDFCESVGAQGVVKGLRAMTDFEYELQQADLNAHMAPHLESIFVMSNPKYGYVSSSIVRELASLQSDVSFLVPACVAQALATHVPSRPNSNTHTNPYANLS